MLVVSIKKVTLRWRHQLSAEKTQKQNVYICSLEGGATANNYNSSYKVRYSRRLPPIGWRSAPIARAAGAGRARAAWRVAGCAAPGRRAGSGSSHWSPATGESPYKWNLPSQRGQNERGQSAKFPFDEERSEIEEIFTSYQWLWGIQTAVVGVAGPTLKHI